MAQILINILTCHFSIICRGEFDDQLKWPFDGSVTVEANNCTTEKWSNNRPLWWMNKYVVACLATRSKNTLVHGSLGYYDYIPHSQINHYNIKDICWLRFHVTNMEIVHCHVYELYHWKFTFCTFFSAIVVVIYIVWLSKNVLQKAVTG